MMEHLLSSLDKGGLIGTHIAPLRTRLNAMLATGDASASEVRKRVRLLAFAPRKLPLENFAEIGRATIKRRRMRIDYYARSTDKTSTREIPPQRLVHYRENWYLDAWCHLRNDLRSFAIDGIRALTVLEDDAREVPASTLEEYIETGYGIVRGNDVQWATLRFSSERARWVKSEIWHPEQRSSSDRRGRYTMELPYRDDRELLLEIMKHGSEVEVLEPSSLREKVREAHLKAAGVNR